MYRLALVALCIASSFDSSNALGPLTIINVVKFGAVGDGKADDTIAFSKAWTSACSGAGNPTLLVPPGKTFLLQPLIFQGPCKSPITSVKVLGNIIAPKSTSWGSSGENSWLLFSRVNGLIVEGSGQINGQGSAWWGKQQTQVREVASSCERPTALRFLGCSNVQLRGLTHLDSPRNHIAVVDSNSVTISNVHIIAPENSPNTDGINVYNSSHVNIQDSSIGTGDDCIALKAGSTFVNITGIACGPGHGISIGSLGDSNAIETVEDVHVRNCNLTKTQNGVRIKTWPGGKGFARRITFEQITVVAAENPIIIDQDYCNGGSRCGSQVSDVKVSDVTYIDMHGSSASQVAISLQCSAIGCSNIQMKQINIVSSSWTKTKVQTACKNVQGTATSTVPLVPCLKCA